MRKASILRHFEETCWKARAVAELDCNPRQDRRFRFRTSGGIADIKQGQYRALSVAVKTLRVSEEDKEAANLGKIRKVRA